MKKYVIYSCFFFLFGCSGAHKLTVVRDWVLVDKKITTSAGKNVEFPDENHKNDYLKINKDKTFNSLTFNTVYFGKWDITPDNKILIFKSVLYGEVLNDSIDIVKLTPDSLLLRSIRQDNNIVSFVFVKGKIKINLKGTSTMN